MNLNDEKVLMGEAAVLYYEKKHTQQEIATLMNLSRQTVSKLLNSAVEEKIVEIKVHNPQKECERLQTGICSKFDIRTCVVCRVSSKNEALRHVMNVKAAVEYVTPLLRGGGLRIGLSWGRTVRDIICDLPKMHTADHVVYPLFGATDHKNAWFSSNELVRNMAEKTGSDAKYAWFPYLVETKEERRILQGLSYYKNIENLWRATDVAIVGIGDTEILKTFYKTFGCKKNTSHIIGDVATHFFDENGTLAEIYENNLCASAENIRNAKETIAVASGDDKVKAIIGALRTKLIDTLITDEYTAEKILEN